MQQLSLFPEATAPSSSLIGLKLQWPSKCLCGANTVIVGSSRAMHEAAVKCGGCGVHRGFLCGHLR